MSGMPERAKRARHLIGFAPLALGAFAALLWLERRSALRSRREPGTRRIARNVAVAALTSAAVTLAERPVVAPLARRVHARRIGALYLLQNRLGLSDGARDALAVLLLDYTLYWWHVAEHRVRWIYRFHVVHHADLDLDTSTALRFHFGEFLLSIPWRAAQIVSLGVSPRALALWQRLTTLEVMFHHSNVRLPLRLERWLSALLVTPRLHGIHHSTVPDEQDSNWSSGLTIWDRLHGTYRANVPQREIEIGVAALRSPADVTLPRIVAMPFRRQAALDRGPTGERPKRRGLDGDRARLAR